MDKKLINKTVFLVIAVSVLNLAAGMYVFFKGTGAQFHGYMTGVVLAIILSGIWLWQVWNGVSVNFIVLLRFMMKGLMLRMAVLLLFIAGLYFFVSFDRLYFAIAFLAGMVLGLIIEVWFYQALLARERLNRAGVK